MSLPPRPRCLGDDEGLVDDLCEIEDGLSAWEVEFVESLARHVGRRLCLSVGQIEKAEEILEAKG